MASRAPAEPTSLGLDAPEASRTTLLALATLGVAFDLTFNGQNPGLAVPLFALALAAAFRTVARRSVSTDMLLSGSVVFATFPALRASPDLAILDVFAAAALLGLAATQDVERIARSTVLGLLRRGLALARRSLAVPGFVAAPFASPAERSRARRALRAASIAAPILVLFAALLASGDPLFAKMLESILPEWNATSILSHLTLTLVGSALVAILWRSALGEEEAQRERQPLPGLPEVGSSEWATVLGGINLLFGAFVVVQVRYLFGGGHRVEVTPGLTHAEYARSGFFQLAAAAALTVLVILAAWDAGKRDGRRQEMLFRGLVTGLVALTGVVLASALTRLALYEGTFGFTVNRFFGYVAIASIGVVLCGLVVAIWMGGRDRVVVGFVVVGLTALLAVNVLNPERFVAGRNVARFEAIGKIDVSYMGFMLGADAVPVATTMLGRLGPEDAQVLRAGLCERLDRLGQEPSWRSVNAGRASARRALSRAGIARSTCANPAFTRTR
jgi:hypothetical protein